HRLPYILAKLFAVAWIVSIMVLSIIDMKHPSFWLAYLTHWGLLFATAYFVMSAFLSAIYLAMRPSADPGVLEGGVGLLVKTTWALFVISFPVEVAITILYWTLESNGTTKYVDIMQHGGVLVLIIIDSCHLRIQLRMKQFIIYEVFCALYLLWNLILAYSGIGNPYTDDGTQDDDAIYESLAWKNDTVGAITLSVGV
ncbi:hypothetical protein ACHAXR_000552, partial [Thalassiosira sp. AJA248-18]